MAGSSMEEQQKIRSLAHSLPKDIDLHSMTLVTEDQDIVHSPKEMAQEPIVERKMKNKTHQTPSSTRLLPDDEDDIAIPSSTPDTKQKEENTPTQAQVQAAEKPGFFRRMYNKFADTTIGKFIISTIKVLTSLSMGRILGITSAFIVFAVAGFVSGGIIPALGLGLTVGSAIYGISLDAIEVASQQKLIREKRYLDDFNNAKTKENEIIKDNPQLENFRKIDRSFETLSKKNADFPDLGRTQAYPLNSILKSALKNFMEFVTPLVMFALSPISSVASTITRFISSTITLVITPGLYLAEPVYQHQQNKAKYAFKTLINEQRTKIGIQPYSSSEELAEISLDRLVHTKALAKLAKEEPPTRELFEQYKAEARNEIMKENPNYAKHAIDPQSKTGNNVRDLFSGLVVAAKFNYNRYRIDHFEKAKASSVGHVKLDDITRTEPKAVRRFFMRKKPVETPNLKKEKESILGR